jgi:hypothetical protein
MWSTSADIFSPHSCSGVFMVEAVCVFMVEAVCVFTLEAAQTAEQRADVGSRAHGRVTRQSLACGTAVHALMTID